MKILPKLLVINLFILVVTQEIKAQNASDTDSIRQLTGVVVTYQANLLTPITFQNIQGTVLKKKSTGQEPSFLLMETPSITAYSDAGNTQGYSYFRLRGIDQTRINISLDGVPLNEPEDQGAYFSNYPDLLSSASKIQIQRGIGISKNGTASYGGSLQVFSPNLTDSTRTTIGFGYGSFNSLRAFGEYNSGVKSGKAIYIRASSIHSDGYKYNSSNNSESVFISSGLFGDKQTWKLNMLIGDQKNEMAWLGVSESLINADRRTNAHSNKNENDHFTQALVQVQNQWRSHNALVESSIYYTYLKGNYDFDLNNFLGLPTNNEFYNYALRSDLLGFFTNYTISGKQLSLTTGIHGNTYNRQHRGSETSQGELYLNRGYKDEFSIFLKGDYTIKILTLFLDIQHRQASFDYRGSVPLDKTRWFFVNPKAGLSIQANSDLVFYYSVGRTGREPTRNDLFGGNDDLQADNSGSAVLFINDPEYVTDHELGLKQESQNWQFGLNLFYMDFDNEIVLEGKFGPNGLPLTNNVEKSYRTGIELQSNYELNTKISLVTNASLIHSRIKEQQETFSPILTPSVLVNQEVQYLHKNLSLGVIVRYQGESFIDFANSTSLDDFFLVNCRIGYQNKSFEIDFFLNNITNSRYFSNGYVDFDGSKKYFVQAPANFYASVKYRL